MIYYEQSFVDETPTLFLVEDNLSNFMIMRNRYNEDCEYQIYNDYNQTKLAPSILDRW